MMTWTLPQFCQMYVKMSQLIGKSLHLEVQYGSSGGTKRDVITYSFF